MYNSTIGFGSIKDQLQTILEGATHYLSTVTEQTLV